MTPAEFKAEFPEFVGASDALVQAKLNDATRQTSAPVWGEFLEDGIKYRTADLLAKSPMGRKMRLVLKDGRTAYSDDLERLERTVAMGIRVF